MVDIGEIDIMGVRKDGGVELSIVCVRKLEGTPEMQKKLMDKIENYLNYINSKEFKSEFGNKTKEEVFIILKCEEKPDDIMFQLFEKIKPWTMENNATFLVSIE
jgi:hypothetical protein